MPAYTPDDRTRAIANREIDTAFLVVLDYNRNDPGDDETPGETLRRIRDRMDARDRWRAGVQKMLGALWLSLATVILTAVFTAIWPLLKQHLGFSP